MLKSLLTFLFNVEQKSDSSLEEVLEEFKKEWHFFVENTNEKLKRFCGGSNDSGKLLQKAEKRKERLKNAYSQIEQLMKAHQLRQATHKERIKRMKDIE